MNKILNRLRSVKKEAREKARGPHKYLIWKIEGKVATIINITFVYCATNFLFYFSNTHPRVLGREGADHTVCHTVKSYCMNIIRDFMHARGCIDSFIEEVGGGGEGGGYTRERAHGEVYS